MILMSVIDILKCKCRFNVSSLYVFLDKFFISVHTLFLLVLKCYFNMCAHSSLPNIF